MTPFIEISGRRIGPGYPVYVVAEMSANHNHDFDSAADLVKAAHEAGADAIKLQTYTADTLTIPSGADCFRIKGGTPWDGSTLYDLYREASMSWEWQPRLKAIAAELGIDCFSSAFDPSAVDFLEQMDVPAHKVASFEIVDIPLIRKMARTRKPLIISTGMATMQEIQEAVEAASQSGASQIALLKCTSAYPAPPEEMNLRAIPLLAEQFSLPVGLSDHSLGPHIAVGAVALGACIVEKHLTLSRAAAGPDSSFSMEPDEFKTMVQAVRTLEKAMGDGVVSVGAHEEASRALRRSLFVVKDMTNGELFTEENVRSIRPAAGLEPKHFDEILGRRAARDISRGTPLAWDLVS